MRCSTSEMMTMSIPDYPEHRDWIEREKQKMREAGKLRWEQVPESPSSTQSQAAQPESDRNRDDQTH